MRLLPDRWRSRAAEAPPRKVPRPQRPPLTLAPSCRSLMGADGPCQQFFSDGRLSLDGRRQENLAKTAELKQQAPKASSPYTLNPKPSILNPQPANLRPQSSILNPQPSTPNPRPPSQLHCLLVGLYRSGLVYTSRIAPTHLLAPLSILETHSQQPRIRVVGKAHVIPRYVWIPPSLDFLLLYLYIWCRSRSSPLSPPTLTSHTVRSWSNEERDLACK